MAGTSDVDDEPATDSVPCGTWGGPVSPPAQCAEDKKDLLVLSQTASNQQAAALMLHRAALNLPGGSLSDTLYSSPSAPAAGHRRRRVLATVSDLRRCLKVCIHVEPATLAVTSIQELCSSPLMCSHLFHT